MQRQLLYVNSAKRTTGTPSDFTICLGHESLHSRDTSTSTRLALTEAIINRSWPNVTTSNNAFNLLGTGLQPVTFMIPAGSYNALDLRIALAQALPQGWSVTYSRIQTGFTITRPADEVQIYMLDLQGLAQLLGFTQGSSLILSQLLPSVSSTQPARISAQNCLLVHSDIQKQGNAVLDNQDDAQTFRDSSVIAKIAIDRPPADNLVFRATSELDFVQIPSTNTSTVRLWITDENHVPIQLSFDWTCTLTILHEPKQSTDGLDIAKEVRDLLKLAVLSNKKVLS